MQSQNWEAEFAPEYKMELARGKCAKGLTLTLGQGWSMVA